MNAELPFVTLSEFTSFIDWAAGSRFLTIHIAQDLIDIALVEAIGHVPNSLLQFDPLMGSDQRENAGRRGRSCTRECVTGLSIWED